NNSDELYEALIEIIDDAIDADLPTGPGTTVNDFGVGADGEPGKGQIIQTSVSAFTEFPGWKGHVVRGLCTDVDPDTGDLEAFCTLPDPEFAAEEIEETFGPCEMSHAWDAGECLKLTDWNDRRLFTNTDDNTVVPIANSDGSASDAFKSLLEDKGYLTTS